MSQQEEEKDFFSLSNILSILKTHWIWFIISAIFCTGLGYVYLKTKPNVYQRTAQLLIKDDTESTSSALSDMAGLDLFNQPSNLFNELAVIQSPDIMYEVVKKLGLEKSYTLIGLLRKTSLYGDSIPVDITVSNTKSMGEGEKASVSFRVVINENNSIELSKFKENGKKVASETIIGSFNLPFKTPIGTVTIRKTASFAKKKRPFKIDFSETGYYSAALNYCKRVKASNINNKSSVIELSINDTSIKRGDDILTELINEYNKSWKEDKNIIAKNTSAFIEDRLEAIQAELGTVDTDISQYKTSNLLPDVSTASSIYMKQANEANANILDLSNQLYMAKYVKNFMKSMSSTQTLPTNSGFESQAIANQISKYNESVLERNNLVSVSSESNPIVEEMDANLNNLRSAIEASIENQIVSLGGQLETQQKAESEAINHIAANPEQAKYLLKVERQQKVKETLYLYLLQKLEENELTQSFAASNNRLILKPNGSAIPVSPKRSMILMGAFLFGLCLPFFYFFIKDQMITTISGRPDLSKVTIPFIGEIPISNHKKSLGFFGKLFKKNKNQAPDLVVAKGSRNIVNEAFRLLRTNLEMLTGKNQHGNTFTVTSFNPGSGKSFICMNLAMTLTFKDIKVAVVDCDMRHGSTSEYVDSPSVGLVDFLSGDIQDPNEIIVNYPGSPNLSVVPIGKIPPNPTELLENGRFEQLLDVLKQEYDYVLVDCPPIQLVADTQIIERLTDRTIFIVRVGLMRRNMVGELETLYKEKRFKNMSLILNGVQLSRSSYYATGKNSHYYINN